MSRKDIGIPLEGLAELSRIAAAQGAVLLKNEEGTLPIQHMEKLSVFGRCQIDYYRSGTGSGGAVNVAYSTGLLDALRKNERVVVNEELAHTYEAWTAENPFDNGGGGWAAEPWCQKEMPISKELAEAASAYSSKALVVIGRTAGEDKDNSSKAGSYLLTQEEIAMLDMVTCFFDQVILLLNVSNIIDMSWLEEAKWADKIKSVIYVWQGGIEGGSAAADVITGLVTPSGKLTDTIAYHIKDYPSDANYGGNEKNIYAEDIYVGYRYFETFCPGKVQFPFGFGLSYTDFSIECRRTGLEEDGLFIEAEATNTGNIYNGREVIQVYCEPPQGKLGRPARELAGFAKTGLLECGESQTVRIFIPWRRLASYDDSGITGNKSAYVMEAGEYHFYMGNSVRNTVPITIDGKKTYHLKKLRVLEQHQEALAPSEPFERLRPGVRKGDGTYEVAYEPVPLAAVDMKRRIEENLPKDLPITEDRGIRLVDVEEGRASMEEFVAQLKEEELAALVRGEGMCSLKVTPGTAAAFGGVTDKLKSYGIPIGCCADGPSGIRMDGGACATQLPIGTLLACTWDTELVERLFTQQGIEMIQNQVDTLLGPGINIHRHPLNGRNFEYFSEDPLITGAFAAAVVRGIGMHGAQATVKHFACNSQETGRSVVDSVVSEKAVREIYLKGFEMAVTEGKAQSIMTAYNPINGHHAASNYDLNTTILRKEWGFKGIVMTDWWAKMNDVVDGGEAGIDKTRDMVRAQNDLYMVVSNDGAGVNAFGDNTLEALRDKRLTLGELQRSAANICGFLMNAPAFSRTEEAEEILAVDSKEQADAGQEEAVRQTEDGIRLRMGSRKKIAFYVEKPGIYQMENRIMSREGHLAQTVCKAFLNQEPVVTFQLNGTGGRWVNQRLIKLELSKGWYELELVLVIPGMEVDYLELQWKEEKSL